MAEAPALVIVATANGLIGASPPPPPQPQHPADSAVSTPVNTREVHKNGWLKRIPSRDKRTPPFVKPPKPEKVWVVFCIHDDVNAFLEYYDSRRSAFSHRPAKSVALANCVHVSPNIVVNQELEPDFVFSIALDVQVIKLAAASRDQMTEWIDALKNKLTEIGVLQPRCNIYTKGPESRFLLAANRDPTSPLPPPPVAPRPFNTLPRASSEPSSPTFVPNLSTENSAVAPRHIPAPPSRQQLTLPLNFLTSHRSSSASQPTSPMTPTSPQSAQQQQSSDVSTALPPSLVQSREQHLDIGRNCALPVSVTNNTRFDFNSSAFVLSTSVTAQLQNANNNNEDGSNMTGRSGTFERLNDNDHQPMASLYEPIFLTPVTDRIVTCGIRNPSYFNPPQPMSAASRPPTLPLRTFSRPRASSEERPPASHTSETLRAYGNLNMMLLNDGDDMGSDENRRPLTLREKQALVLCREINSRGGVRLLLPRKDCINTIAFVESFGSVWIAGWKQREHPFLYHSFHIGDRVLKVGGHELRTVQEVQKAIRAEVSSKLEFIIARVPHGQVHALKREMDGQDIGLVRDGNTAEVIEVVPGGLAYRSGLPAKSSVFGNAKMCNWMITEINDRPLNLFFKDREVQDRLNAVGKEISILVQPSDFVKSLKKQLKSMWGYKDYIVQ